MIGILVNGTPLYIPADCTITMQQSAAWADIDNLTSDIVWTFNLPAEPNSITLEQAQYLVVSNHKGYDCEITFDSIPIASGTLYVQQATDEKSLSCGITFNTFAIGWGSKKLKDDQLGDDIEIATSASTFQREWLTFLASTLSADSLIKFMMFVDEDFLSDNDDFGYFRNLLSNLDIYRSEDLKDLLESKLVNRLTFDSDGNIINLPSSSSQGLRIFNEDSGLVDGNKINGYHFAPAIQLLELIKRVSSSAGFQADGTFMTHENIKKLFVQSLNAMDGNILQYPVEQYIKVYGDIVPNTATPQHLQLTMPFTIAGGGTANGFRMSGPNQFPSVDFRLLIPSQELYSERISEGVFNQVEEAWFLAVRLDSAPSSATLPTYRHMTVYRNDVRHYFYGDLLSRYFINSIVGLEPSSTATVMFTENGTDQDICVCNDTMYNNYLSLISGMQYYDFIQLTKDVKNPEITTAYLNNVEGAYTEGSYILERWAQQSHHTEDQNFRIQLVKARVHSHMGGGTHVLDIPGGQVYYNFALDGACLQKIDSYEVMDYANIDYNDTPLNVFSRVLKWADHVPNMTNADFLKAICKFFGLNLYVNSFSKTMQLSFFKDIVRSQALDITEYVTAFTKQNYSPEHRKLTISPARGSQNINSSKVLPSVDTIADLPSAVGKKNKYCFVKAENAYYKSTKDKDSSRYHWTISHGTDENIEVGDIEKDSSTEQADIIVSNMRTIDRNMSESTSYTPKMIEEISQSGCSAMFQDTYSGEFPMVLRQYRGRRLINVSKDGAVTQCYIEDGNPTNLNPDGTVDDTSISLTECGYNAVGEMWQRPLNYFLANKEDFEFTLHIPFSFFLQLYSLMQPQQGSESQQVRWVYYRSQYYLPSMISYQFSASDTIIATISCSRI